MTLNVNQHFVDRTRERALFARMLSGEMDARVLRVLIPAEHGKSWFIERLCFDCEEHNVPVVWLDFRSDKIADARYVVERFLQLLDERHLPRTRAVAEEWRRTMPSIEADAHYRLAAGRALRDDLAHWTAAPGTANDEFTRYENGVAALLARLGEAHPHYLEAVNYRTRLIHENITATRLYGNTETRRAERHEILTQINRLTLDVWGLPFDDLCSTPATATAPPQPIAILLDTFEQIDETVRAWLADWLFDGLRRTLAHVRVVVAGRPVPKCHAFFDRAGLWGHLVAAIDHFEPMSKDEIREYYRRRGRTFGDLDPDTICYLARESAGMMALLGDSLVQGGGH